MEGRYYTSVVVLLVSTLNMVQTGEVRCFCNLPVCVTSGYMCKSTKDGCFSDLFDFLDVYKARHGCVELLDKDRQGQCQNQPGSARGHPRSLLLCCRSDMCNHVDSPEIKIRVNDTFLGSILNATETRVFTSVDYNSNEVWFKAATIAVPICGALILFILIALAVKILRRDGLDAARLTPKQVHGADMYAELSSKMAPLLLRHHNAGRHAHDKNETHAKLNFALGGEGKRRPEAEARLGDAHKPNNATYRDVNIALATTRAGDAADRGKYYDKQGLSFCGDAGTPSHV